MTKNKPRVPKEKINPKRTSAKMKRGFGKGMIEKLGITESEWTQRHDPFFKIKGNERHKMLKSYKEA